MFIHELREACSLIVDIIDERNELLEENFYLREQLKEKNEREVRRYNENMSAVADILNTMIVKQDMKPKGR